MRIATILLFAASLPVFAQPTAGLVGFWPLNSDFMDASGYGIHGDPNNSAVQPTDNRDGGADCAYRMIEGGFSTATTPLLEVQPTGGLTISYWIRQGQADSFGRVMVQPTGSALAIILETWYAGLPTFGQLGAEFSADSSQITFDGQWHMITGVYDAGNWYLYSDHSLVQQDTSGTVLAYPGAAQLTAGGAWNTDLDDIRVYDRALTALEVMSLYEAQPDCASATDVHEAALSAPMVAPNPTTGLLDIRFPAALPDASEIQVLDASGRMVVQRKASGMSAALDLGPFMDGVYEVRVISPGDRRSIRIIKE